VVDLWVNGSAASGNGASHPGEDRDPPVAQIAERLQSAAPDGLRILSIEPVDEHGPALQTRVRSAEYLAALLDPQPEGPLREKVAALLASESLPRERRGKPYDLRPLIEALELADPDPSGLPCLRMQLAAREGATGRPEEVLAALDLDFAAARIERLRLIFLP